MIDPVIITEDALKKTGYVAKISKFRTEVRSKWEDKKYQLQSMIDDVDKPILKEFGQDMLNMMLGWVEDPKILCCLIYGIAGMFYAKNNDTIKATETNLESLHGYIEDFNEFIDDLVAFIDLIIVLMSQDIQKFSINMIDLIKTLMNAVIGAILIALQQAIFSLRDWLIGKIIDWMNDKSGSNLWSKCIPFSDFLRIIKKYVSDYGLLAKWFDKVKAWTSGLFKNWEKVSKSEHTKNVKDLEFLYWLRELLLKMKVAVSNFDLCFDFNSTLPGTNDMSNIDKPFPTNDSTFRPTLNNNGNMSQDAMKNLQGISMANDGTILVNDISPKNNSLLFTDGSVRGFLNNYYSIPYEVVDVKLAGANSSDNIQGSNINSNRPSDLNADCPNAPNYDEFIKWAILIKNKKV